MPDVNDFSEPTEVSDIDLAFPASVEHLMPVYETIPAEFNLYNGTSPFCKIQSKWFYEGLKDETMPPAKPGIDTTKAIRHLACIQRSFEPKHEHKAAAVAYLMSLWFEEP